MFSFKKEALQHYNKKKHIKDKQLASPCWLASL